MKSRSCESIEIEILMRLSPLIWLLYCVQSATTKLTNKRDRHLTEFLILIKLTRLYRKSGNKTTGKALCFYICRIKRVLIQDMRFKRVKI